MNDKILNSDYAVSLLRIIRENPLSNFSALESFTGTTGCRLAETLDYLVKCGLITVTPESHFDPYKLPDLLETSFKVTTQAIDYLNTVEKEQRAHEATITELKAMTQAIEKIAYSSADQADAAKSIAKASAEQADSAERIAKTSAEQATSAETIAKTSADQAVSAETIAKASADQAVAAESLATTAKEQAEAAKVEAEKAEKKAKQASICSWLSLALAAILGLAQLWEIFCKPN